MSKEVAKLIDVLNEQGQETGEQKDFSAIHRDGDWHKSFHLWIIKDQNYVLLQRRSEYKDLEPQRLSASMTSHFLAGETLLHLIDKVEQKLGLKLELKELTYFETNKVKISYPNAIDHEFQEVYLTFCNKPLSSYYLNYKEVEVLYELPINKALELYHLGSYTAAAGFDAYQRENNAVLIKDDLSTQTRESITKILEKIKASLQVKLEL